MVWAVGAFFVAWGMISIICQPRTRLSAALRQREPFGLIPTWTFFAPNPVSADHYLYYRDHSIGNASKWKRAFSADNRSLVDFVWCPLRREEKALHDALFSLVDMAEAMPTERVYLSVPYLTVLSYVTSLRHIDGAVATQFLFAIKRPDRKVGRPP